MPQYTLFQAVDDGSIVSAEDPEDAALILREFLGIGPKYPLLFIMILPDRKLYLAGQDGKLTGMTAS